MQERILELIIYLMEELNADQTIGYEVDFITSELKRKGFSEYEIGIALSWVLEKVSDEYKEESIDNDAFRMLSASEKFSLSPEVHGYLISLKQIQLINNTDLENIIQHLSQLEQSDISLDLVKYIIAHQLIHLEPFEGQFSYKLMFNGTNSVH